MSRKLTRRTFMAASAAGAAAATFKFPAPAIAQSAPSSQKQLDFAALKANRKALVGQAMALSEQEAQGFWPLYEQYESKMDALEMRHADEVRAFAKASRLTS